MANLNKILKYEIYLYKNNNYPISKSWIDVQDEQGNYMNKPENSDFWNLVKPVGVNPNTAFQNLEFITKYSGTLNPTIDVDISQTNTGNVLDGRINIGYATVNGEYRLLNNNDFFIAINLKDLFSNIAIAKIDTEGIITIRLKYSDGSDSAYICIAYHYVTKDNFAWNVFKSINTKYDCMIMSALGFATYDDLANNKPSGTIIKNTLYSIQNEDGSEFNSRDLKIVSTAHNFTNNESDMTSVAVGLRVKAVSNNKDRYYTCYGYTGNDMTQKLLYDQNANPDSDDTPRRMDR